MSNSIFEFSMSNDLTLEFLGRANYKTRFCFNKEVIRIPFTEIDTHSSVDRR